MLYTELEQEQEQMTGLVESYQDAGSVCILRRAEFANTDPAEEDRQDRWIRRNDEDSILPPVSQVQGSGNGNLLPPLMRPGHGSGSRNLMPPIHGSDIENVLPSSMRIHGSRAGNPLLLLIRSAHGSGNGNLLPMLLKPNRGSGTRNLLLHSQMVEP